MTDFVAPLHIDTDSDSRAIQYAVDKAHAEKINKVVIPRINPKSGKPLWIITETIRLPSDMTVVLDNCFMQMADGVVGGFFKSETLFTEAGCDPAQRLHNITIVGRGNAVLDGGKPTDLNEGTQNDIGIPVRLNSPIFLMNVEGFRVENISITNQRYWGMRFQFCSHGIIRDIKFVVSRDRRNQDGINLRNGCHDVLIENIFGQTGDDMIALSAIDTDRAVGFNIDYPLIVKGESWDIHDVTIRSVSGAAIRHPLVAMRNHNGARLYNIHIENIRDTEEISTALNDNFERYALITVGNNSYAGIRPAVEGETYGITVKDISVRYSVRAICMQSAIQNLRVEGVSAYGVCRAILATTPDGWANAKSGVKLDGATLRDVYFAPDSSERSKLLDFSVMRTGDYVRNLYIDNVTMKGVGCFAKVDDSLSELDIDKGRVRADSDSSCEIIQVPHYDETPKELESSVWLVRGVPTHEIDM